MNDWQSWAALGIVVITLAIFVRKALTPRKKGGCGGGCGCSHKPGVK
ncbi:MAG TPA: FeoB-associated Cys-rich membrane protein [Prosthecobacter sp.]